MQFVNVTKRTVYTSLSGRLLPGQVSSDGGKGRRRLEEALREVVDMCGGNLGIRLNSREASLLDRLMTLDEKGSGFKLSSLPKEIREDPTGEKANEESIRAAQQREMDARAEANAKSMAREAMINGETVPGRKPVGPATMEGVKVDPANLKSGFEQIMEENAKIAAGKKVSSDELLDPIGAHMKDGDGKARMEEGPADVSKIADAAAPEPAKSGETKMDRQAEEVAEGLSIFNSLKKSKGSKETKGSKSDKSAKPKSRK